MMSKFVSVAVLMLAAVSSAAAEDKPTVTVYYESLCTDSIRFVTKQLFPSFTSSMKNYYTLKMVPFGKSKLVSGSDPTTWKFTCHHGERECYGNKVHGCALEKVRDLETSLKFIVCLMKKTLEDKSAPYPVMECASMNGLNSQDIILCANHTAGTEILKKYQEETDRFMMPLSSVPTISFDGKYEKQIQEMAVDNFAMALCKHIENPPHECQTLSVNAAGIREITIFTLFLAAIRFFF